MPEAAPPTATPNGSASTGNSSVDVTDNQVEGVEEGDIIKRSQTHIFYLKTNKLEVYICFLRRKIERPTGLHLITTVRGKGYRLE